MKHKPYRGYAIDRAMYRGHLFFFAKKGGREVARAEYLYELKTKIDQICEARHERA